MRHVLVVVFVAFVFISAAAAQPPQPVPPGSPAPGVPGGQATPARAGAARADAPATGTAVLRGYVVAADTGEPVRRAIVRAMAANAGGSMTSTDAEGRFEFRDLPAGRYMLSASKGGYVGVQYGQRRPNQSGTPLDLRDGEVIEKIAIALPPGSVITGRVFDDFGDPVSGVMVSAMRYRSMGGRRQLGPAGGEGAMSRTDDQGN
ncbi:MAG: carboxypeptidase regulatory-like domain-containing protein, partial [Vicinamibacteria bacterium]